MTNRTFSVHRAAWAARLLCALVAGCDPLSTSSGSAAGAPLASPIDMYSQCYGGCYTAGTNETNRETCKLDCDGLAEISLGASADPVARRTYEHLRGCLIACWDDRHLSETNRSTCLLTCAEDAEVEATPPPRRTLEVVPGTVLAPDAELPPGVRPPSGS
jgi:hypothetical protein